VWYRHSKYFFSGLEIPRPFQTLAEHRRERREREVQLDLRSFDLEEESIIQQTIEWEE